MSRAIKIILALLLTVPLSIALIGFVFILVVVLSPFFVVFTPYIIFKDLLEKRELLNTDEQEEDR